MAPKYPKGSAEFKEHAAKWARERLLLNRNKLLVLLGAKCARCGFSDERALQFDHIKGEGGKDIHRKGHYALFYRYYVNHPQEAKNTLQILCSNCNWIKKMDRHEHKPRKY